LIHAKRLLKQQHIKKGRSERGRSRGGSAACSTISIFEKNKKKKNAEIDGSWRWQLTKHQDQDRIAFWWWEKEGALDGWMSSP
jgi:hypothetical protein